MGTCMYLSCWMRVRYAVIRWFRLPGMTPCPAHRCGARRRAGRQGTHRTVGQGHHPTYGVSPASVRSPPAHRTDRRAALQLSLIRSHRGPARGPRWSGSGAGADAVALHTLASGPHRRAGVHCGCAGRAAEQPDRCGGTRVRLAGCSGDLAPLSAVALALMGEGRCTTDRRRRPAGEAMAEAGVKPVELARKEGWR